MQLEPLTGVSVFQSTHPARGATALQMCKQIVQQVSIHAPREGCDRFYLPKEY